MFVMCKNLSLDRWIFSVCVSVFCWLMLLGEGGWE